LLHDCISFRQSSSGQIERWEFDNGVETIDLQIKGRLILNDSEILVRSALDGLGIAYMINGYIEPFIEQGRLVRVLADWSPVIPSLHLYYPDRRRVPAKLRALIDFLHSEHVTPQLEELIL
jgi:DNA-binding transcriptional LysR family regulator